MCAATRYPEAVPLRTLKAHAIVKALVKFFFFHIWPPKMNSKRPRLKFHVQNLRPGNVNVKHKTSSAYHPESQGALERFHQTLKSMLRKFCTESNREWDEGLPLLLFAVRETIQESLGFSPAELVFGHTVRGPLCSLREQWLSNQSGGKNILDYVSSFRERLHHACEMARESLSSAQSKMKQNLDKKSVIRSFQPSDRVFVLLPVVGSGLQAKFSGPYMIDRKINETNYVIQSPDRKKKTRACHINMLKQYVDRVGGVSAPVISVSPVVSVAVSRPAYDPKDDGLDDVCASVSCARLCNAQILSDLDFYLSHLSDPARGDIRRLIQNFPTLFGDIPTQTHASSHDTDVGNHQPLKQHAYRDHPSYYAERGEVSFGTWICCSQL